MVGTSPSFYISSSVSFLLYQIRTSIDYRTIRRSYINPGVLACNLKTSLQGTWFKNPVSAAGRPRVGMVLLLVASLQTRCWVDNRLFDCVVGVHLKGTLFLKERSLSCSQHRMKIRPLSMISLRQHCWMKFKYCLLPTYH